MCVWALNKTNADAIDGAEVHVASGKRHVEGATWNVVRGSWYVAHAGRLLPLTATMVAFNYSYCRTLRPHLHSHCSARTEAEGARVPSSPVYAACHTPHMPRENFGRVISITVETIAP